MILLSNPMNPILSLINTTAARFDEKFGALRFRGKPQTAMKTFLRESQLETLEVVKQIAAGMRKSTADLTGEDYLAQCEKNSALYELIEKLSVKE